MTGSMITWVMKVVTQRQTARERERERDPEVIRLPMTCSDSKQRQDRQAKGSGLSSLPT